VGTPVLSLRGKLGYKWIDVDLSEQRLTAYEDLIPVFSVLVSTGADTTPTPIGSFRILDKVRVQALSGPGYHYPDVQHIMFFYRDYATHECYWHDSFGQPMSHGCVNMESKDAEWIYEWAPVGTPVRVHQ